MTIIDRYNRQELIEGWDQERLNQSRIVVVGSENLANYILGAITALGIGNIEIYGNERVGENKEFLLFQAMEGESKVKGLESILKQMNPLSRIKGINSPISMPILTMMGKPNLIIEATNSPESKERTLKYAQSRGINFISAVADSERAEMEYFPQGIRAIKPKSITPSKKNILDELIGGSESLKEEIAIKEEKVTEKGFENYDKKFQGATPSGVMGGFIAEEVRKILMPLSSEEVPSTNLAYSLCSDRRFSSEEGRISREKLKDKKILIVGAGGLGTFTVPGAALEGIGQIDLMDFDEIESTNLNRQILFYDSLGQMKSTALAEKVSRIAPKIKINGIVGKLDENSDYFLKNKPDAILDCVDSFAVRAIINYFAVRYQIPLISGGTNPKAGQVVVYVPGKTGCLDCKLNVDQALAEKRKGSSCRYAPDPSVIMTNQIIGNMIVGETMKVLDPENNGEPIRRILKYDSTSPIRGGLTGSDEACACTRPEIKEWLKELDGRVKE